MDPATPETPVAAPEASVTPAAPETPAVSPKLQKLQELGFEGVKDENEAFDRLVEAHKQMKDQFASQLQEALSQVRSQIPQPQQPTQPATKKFFDPPAVDLALVQQYRQPDGSWKDGTPSDLRTQAESRERYIQGFAQKLVTDPEAALAPLLEQKFAEFFDARYGQLSQQQQEQAFFQRAYAENDWLFAKDPISGRPTSKLSPEGERFNELMLQAHEEYGITNRIKQFEFAQKMRAVEKGQRTPTPDPSAARVEKQQELLGRATPTTKRDGTLPAAPTARNRNLSPGQRLVQQLQRDGVQV